MLTSSFNIFYSGFMIVFDPRIISDFPHYLLFARPLFFTLTNEFFLRLIICMCFAITYIHGTLPPLQFFFRYRLLSCGHTEYTEFYKLFAAGFIFWISFCLSYLADFVDTEILTNATFYNVPGCDLTNHPAMSALYKSSLTSRIHEFIISAILLCSFLLVLYLSYKTLKRLKTGSFASRKLNYDLNLVLFLQAMMPFSMIILPVLLLVSGLAKKDFLPYVAVSTTAGSIAMPALDASIILFVLPAFRKRLQKFIGVLKSARVQRISQPSASEYTTANSKRDK
uniref:G_PROTEIN_RECEP_F1_2 domain-containing protein n=1 Tax=Bursaphelenchus xylophilus TaxID=6326 RepID=A0A1I7RP82_BURXY